MIAAIEKPKSILGDLVKVKIGGEFRYRFELRHDFNFNETPENDTINLFRTRLDMDFTLDPYLRFFVEGQDSESVAQTHINESTSFVDVFDIYQLYAAAKSPFKSIPIDMKVGRQTLFYGEERFVGFNDDVWSNVAPLIDAVKVVYKPTHWLQADIFYGQPVIVERSEPDTANHNDNLFGLYTTLGPYHEHTLDTFLFYRYNPSKDLVGENSGDLGQLKEYTAGNRLRGKYGNFDYGAEYAVQFGSRANNNIQAWAWHNDIAYTFDTIRYKPRISFEYDHGSGDSDPHDGTVETFDNFFPGNHKLYGFIDFTSLRNIDDLKLGSQITPNSKLKLSADYHWFFLDTNKDAWYKGSGTGTIRSSSAGASKALGQEIDLLAKWQVSKEFSLGIGYSYFLSGPFIKETGAHENPSFFYAQSQVKF